MEGKIEVATVTITWDLNFEKLCAPRMVPSTHCLAHRAG
jgi:hypothetical protein